LGATGECVLAVLDRTALELAVVLEPLPPAHAVAIKPQVVSSATALSGRRIRATALSGRGIRATLRARRRATDPPSRRLRGRLMCCWIPLVRDLRHPDNRLGRLALGAVLLAPGRPGRLTGLVL
jgi:hypothetical protein